MFYEPAQTLKVTLVTDHPAQARQIIPSTLAEQTHKDQPVSKAQTGLRPGTGSKTSIMLRSFHVWRCNNPKLGARAAPAT